MRQVDGRLERRPGQAPQKSIPHRPRRGDLPAPDDPQGVQLKKRAAPDTAEGLARSWQEASRRGEETHSVARELADNLRGLHGPIPAAVVVGMIAGWRKRYAPNTINKRVRVLKKILRSIDAQQGTSLAALVPRPGPIRARLRMLQPGELERLLQHAKLHMRLLVLFGVLMGLRFAECLDASPSGYDPEKNTLTVRTKGGKDKTFPVPPPIAAILAVAPRFDGLGFIESLRGKKCSSITIRADWEKLIKAAAITPPLIPHDLRRTAAVNKYRETKDIFAAKALLGHEALGTTAHYLKAHEATLEPTYAAIWTPKGERVQ